MPANVKAIPDEYRGATPYLYVKGAAAAIDFYKKAFGATEVTRMADPAGKVGHADIKIGEAHIMLADEFPEMGVLSPKTIGGTSVAILIYVDDVDALAKQAVAAGAKVLRPVADQFYGDRAGKFEDPFGHQWSFATHKEDMTPAEMENRAAALHGGKS
jgi:PhnB protein